MRLRLDETGELNNMNYEITNFETDVLERSHQIPVLVDFWAEWCGPCKLLGPVLERLAENSDGNWALAKLDTEKFKEIAATYDIRSIPNVKLFVDGKVSGEFVGALPETLVKQWLRKNIPGKYKKVVDAAQELLLKGETIEAESILQDVIANEPENHRARVLLAQTYLETDQKKAVNLLTNIQEDSEYYSMAESIRTFAALLETDYASLEENPVKQSYIEAIESLRGHDFDQALEKFIGVIRSDRYYDDDGARKACIAIFRILGEENEITQKHRRDFNSALY
jgi:putative thioredoxin